MNLFLVSDKNQSLEDRSGFGQEKQHSFQNDIFIGFGVGHSHSFWVAVPTFLILSQDSNEFGLLFPVIRASVLLIYTLWKLLLPIFFF